MNRYRESTAQRQRPRTRGVVLAAFAWLRCDREDVEDCASFLRGHGILTRSGSQFGADPRYVRVSMLDRDDAYDIFVKRLSSLH
jgi:L-tryptophan---pyruvate aminotransferase